MNYEKRYNETLQRAKSLFGNCPKSSERYKTIAIIFPELKESEDERIRKILLNLFDKLPKNEEFCNSGLTCAKIVAYLERQKEQKPMEIKYAGKIYQVHGVRTLHGRITGYIIEDELGHYDCIINPEEVLGIRCSNNQGEW